MNQSSKTSGAFLLRVGTDGEKWANEFLARFSGTSLDRDTVTAWFQNALEAGRAHGFRARGPEINFGGAPFTLSALSTILKELDASGAVTVTNINPGSVDLLSLGATLAEIGRENGGGSLDVMKRRT